MSLRSERYRQWVINVGNELKKEKGKTFKVMDFLKKYGASAKWLKWVEEDFGIKFERTSNKKIDKPQVKEVEQVDEQVKPVEQVEPTEKQIEQKEVLEVVINKLKQVETMYNSLKEEVNRVKDMKDEVEKTVENKLMNELNNIKTTIIENIKQAEPVENTQPQNPIGQIEEEQTQPIGQSPNLQPDNTPQQVQQNQLAQNNWFNMIPVVIKELKGIIIDIMQIKQATQPAQPQSVNSYEKVWEDLERTTKFLKNGVDMYRKLGIDFSKVKEKEE